jgi:hypothetical protein
VYFYLYYQKVVLHYIEEWYLRRPAVEGGPQEQPKCSKYLRYKSIRVESHRFASVVVMAINDKKSGSDILAEANFTQAITRPHWETLTPIEVRCRSCSSTVRD